MAAPLKLSSVRIGNRTGCVSLWMMMEPVLMPAWRSRLNPAEGSDWPESKNAWRRSAAGSTWNPPADKVHESSSKSPFDPIYTERIPMTTRVLLAEDHALVRSGIRSLLEASKEVEVVGEAGTGREAVEMAAALKPDLVLMDLAMNELNGIDATRQLSAQQSEAHVIMLSMHGDEQYIYEALKAGAKGYVLKSSAFKELLTGIREVVAGRTYVSPSLSNVVMNDYVRRAKRCANPQRAGQAHHPRARGAAIDR